MKTRESMDLQNCVQINTCRFSLENGSKAIANMGLGHWWNPGVRVEIIAFQARSIVNQKTHLHKNMLGRAARWKVCPSTKKTTPSNAWSKIDEFTSKLAKKCGFHTMTSSS